MVALTSEIVYDLKTLDVLRDRSPKANAELDNSAMWESHGKPPDHFPRD